MPNGGVDNCGSCWFNTKNKGERGFRAYQKHIDEPDPAICQVRGFKIPSQLYTYCANHPLRNPGRIDVPLGPAMQHCLKEGEPPDAVHFGDRWLWQESPDTAEVREILLRLLEEFTADPWEEPPFPGPPLMGIVIWQLVEFNEARAIPHLEALVGREARRTERFGPYAWRFEHFAPQARRAIEKLRAHT